MRSRRARLGASPRCARLVVLSEPRATTSLVSILSERWPGLRAVPRVDLVERRTPVARLERASEATGLDLWVKRDDLTASRYGGNKVRKLEYLLGLARAQEADTVLTAGAAGSHHVFATSLYGAELKLRVRAVLFPQPWNEHVEEMLRSDLAVGAELRPVGHVALVPAALAALRIEEGLRRRHALRVPPGGSSPRGCFGYVEAGLELAEQIAAGELPEPEAIYCAFGTGGTAAGLAIGLAAAGITARVVPVRVITRAMANRALLKSLVQRAVRELRQYDHRFPRVADAAIVNLGIEGRQLGRGYGYPTEQARHALAAAAEDGLRLDPTYTAKAFAAVLHDATVRSQGPARATGAKPATRLFLQTLSGAEMAPFLERAPELPRWARRWARR